MKYKVIVSDRAIEMLTRHIMFIANVSKSAAKKEKDKIIKAIERLESDAEMYSFFENDIIPKNKYHKYIIDKRYIVLYQIKDTNVYVDYIVDTREDYSWLIK